NIIGRKKRIDNPANPNGKNSYPQTLINYPITPLPTDAAKKIVIFGLIRQLSYATIIDFCQLFQCRFSGGF
ncbi:hypothetical protein L2D25_26960, partial [Salmonella enterica subsp. enterica serovar Muenchen]|uniref:hypothetical protein n=1 Tax=Salmonella enterica TaxID=28901 RepID=UPI001F113E57